MVSHGVIPGFIEQGNVVASVRVQGGSGLLPLLVTALQRYCVTAGKASKRRSDTWPRQWFSVFVL